MSALFRIVYAAHANGTHHKLALDALNHMQRLDAEAWRRVMLKHVDKYLEGSKAPDNTFKDFKNHVLHVGESYWGGAPEKVEEWYGTTITALRAGNWEDAAYAAGVMSHYYTDPCMPFHTGQTEAENAIHRATEWSINRSYNALRMIGEARFANVAIKAQDGPNWVKEMTCDAAENAHRYYEKLIAHYDIHKGAVVPENGLDSISQTFIAELLMYAAEGFGMMLDRAIAESGVTAPEVGLTLETFLATLKIPSKWIEKKLTNAEDRKLVQAMYDELKATGRVDATLPEDDRTIRDLHASEVLAPKLADRSVKRVARIPAGSNGAITHKVTKFEQALAESARTVEKVVVSVPTVQPRAPAPISEPIAKPVAPVPQAVKSVAHPSALAAPLPAELPDAPPAPVATKDKPLALPPKGTFVTPRFELEREPEREPVRTAPLAPATAIEKPAPAPTATVTHIADAQQKAAPEHRTYLAEADPLEDAPSIGPKLAARFAGLGIHTVADFLGHDPHDMAELLDDSHIDAETIVDWQDQAQLVIEVPGLRGGGAQLLVGAGYRTTEALADADPVDLSADVLTFATSADGRRILRDGNAPDLEKIKDWVMSAREAMAA
jgi:predicted flap endonuclease-1-like 5' DNA nuclease